ncbi:MAG: FAD-binding oxidoreductase [Rhodobacteraceae bacterium]|nr:FAD-binding oxidoreductase [Paracoccaceae bacterium]
MGEKYDAIIIGAGIIGAAIGYELSKQGKKTLNVDMLPAAGYGSTSNSCAIIRVYYSTLDGCAMAYDGYFYWKNWAQYLNAEEGEALAEFHETGNLVLKTEINDRMRGTLAHLDALNISYEHMTQEQVAENFPFYDLSCFAPAKTMDDPAFGEPTGGSIEGGVFFPRGGYVSDPQLATQNIQHAAERVGAEFLFNRRVVDIPVSDNRVQGVVLDDGRRIEAPVVVNVAGPHSSKITEMVGADKDMHITTRALRQEVVHVPAPERADYASNALVWSDSDTSVYSRPEVGDKILIGSEDPPCDEHQFVDPDDYDRNFTDQMTVQTMRYAQRFPALGIPGTLQGCVDLYDVTEDWIPLYDRTCVNGFYLACGSSGNQFKNAPVAAKAMVQLIDACEAGHDHDKLSTRYQLEHVDHMIDLATFSRKREVNQDSSFSVLG